jgi:hypothetical protein
MPLRSKTIPKDLFEFRWEVPEGGYRWVDARLLEGNRLEVVPSADAAGNTLPILIRQSACLGHARRYAPLDEETGLFRILADVEVSREGLLAFANRYGWLGNTQVTVHDPKLQGPGQIPHRPGELWRVWVDAVKSLHLAVRLWEMARMGDTVGLAQHVRWVDDDLFYCFSDPQWMNARIEDPLPAGERCWYIRRSMEDQFLNIHPGDLVVPARYCVQLEMNRQLWDIGARLLWNRSHTHQELCFVPSHLLAAVWLQFAQAVDGNRGYRSCEQCGRWFELSPKMGRADKLFCTGACRSRAARERQLRAGQLLKSGQSIAEIASTVQNTPPVVRRRLKQGAKAAVPATDSKSPITRPQI